MKRWVIFIITILGCYHSIAQSDSIIIRNKWCARKDTLLLFGQGNNLIQVYSPTIHAADLKVKSLDAALRIGTPEISGDTLSVIAMPFPAKGKRMRLAVMNKKTSRQLKVASFSSESIPPLIASVGRIPAGEASRKEILSQTALKIAFPNSLYSYPYSIKEYTFKINSAKGSATIHVNGFFLSREVLQQIKDAPDGTVVDFTDIKVTCPECATRTIDPLKLKIK